MSINLKTQAIIAGALLLTCCKSRDGSLPTIPSPPGVACGTERWSVKTLTDADSIRVDFVNVTATTIATLNGLTQRCSGLPDARTFSDEFHVFEVTGVVQITRSEDDRDIHIALADPADPTKTIVVEVADPVCAAASPFSSLLA